MEGIIVFLLAACLVVGILVLLTVTMHFHQWRRLNRPGIKMQQSSGIDDLLASAIRPLSSMEKKYLRLFAEGKTTLEIAEAMHVEISSVYTMKYRIRKKFPEGFLLPF